MGLFINLKGLAALFELDSAAWRSPTSITRQTWPRLALLGLLPLLGRRPPGGVLLPLLGSKCLGRLPGQAGGCLPTEKRTILLSPTRLPEPYQAMLPAWLPTKIPCCLNEAGLVAC